MTNVIKITTAICHFLFFKQERQRDVIAAIRLTAKLVQAIRPNSKRRNVTCFVSNVIMVSNTQANKYIAFNRVFYLRLIAFLFQLLHESSF